MKHLSQKLCIAVISAMVLFAGCTKKPKRPSPDQTVLGPTGGGSGALNPMDAGGLGVEGTGLQPRSDGVREDEDTIRGLLQPVYFDYDKSAIRAEERSKLQAAKDYLDQNAQYRILLEGRCDWRGTAEYNLGLGDRRANAAKTYLQTIGVPATKIETISKGDLEAKENASDSEAAQDRRVDIVVLKK
jgi:peptidoglycan-associated lipoprotein